MLRHGHAARNRDGELAYVGCHLIFLGWIVYMHIYLDSHAFQYLFMHDLPSCTIFISYYLSVCLHSVLLQIYYILLLITCHDVMSNLLLLVLK